MTTTTHDSSRPRPDRRAAPRRKREAFNPFLPKFMNGTKTLRWLKRVHAWTGFWGALIFLMMGTSGFLLNHRNIAKIETGAPKEVSSVVLNVEPGQITSPDDLGTWAQEAFGIDAAPRAPRAKAPSPTATPETAAFMGTDVTPVPVWQQAFTGPNGTFLVEYAEGASTVKATRTAQNFWGLIKNLHKGAGLGILWVLFIDLTAGALITMSLTGALLWSQLHGPRLLGIGIVTASLLLGLFASLPSFI